MSGVRKQLISVNPLYRLAGHYSICGSEKLEDLDTVAEKLK